MAVDPEEHTGERPGKTVFLGALHDLERVVVTHLFVICPNNSGSTFPRKALATSRRTWNLPWEGAERRAATSGRKDRDMGL